MAQILKDLRIEGFRSFRRAELAGLDEYVPIVGLNSSGKSNVLRALSLLFNGFVDEGRTPPSVAADYCDFISKTKKRISVGATFDFGGRDVRSATELIRDLGSDGRLAIERAWMLGPNRIDLVDSFRAGPSLADLRDLAPAESQAAQLLLQSFQYRYVPNHIRPADFIQSEAQALRVKLLYRLRKTKAYRDGGVDSTMEALTKVAAGMFDALSSTVAKSGGRRIAPDIPSDFADLVFQVGLKSVSDRGTSQPPESQGSGTQSYLLLHVLDLLDSTMREQGFGWKQFTVWGVEEPESFLHAGLRSQFAEDLRAFAADRRRQIFVTTHMDEFVRVADHAWMIKLDDGESSVEQLSSRDALQQSSRLRISSFAHPLMAYPDHPIVIVEGKWDALYLRAAIRSTQRRPRWKLIALDEVDPTQTGGDNVKTYLNVNKAVLASRPLTAPVFVLRDWEDSSKVDGIGRVLKAAHEASACWSCPVEIANPDLGPTFRGIERFLPTAVVESVVSGARLRPHSVAQKLPLGIDGSDLDQAKPGLAAVIEAGHEVGPYLLRLAEWLDDQVAVAFGELPAQLFG